MNILEAFIFSLIFWDCNDAVISQCGARRGQTSYERHTKTLQVRMRDDDPVMIIIVRLCVSNDDNGVSIHE